MMEHLFEIDVYHWPCAGTTDAYRLNLNNGHRRLGDSDFLVNLPVEVSTTFSFILPPSFLFYGEQQKGNGRIDSPRRL